MGIFSKGKPARSEAPEFIEVGQIVNTHGVRGEVKVQPWDVTADMLCGFKTFYMDGVPFRPTGKRVQGDMVLMKLPEIDDVDEAARLKTKVLSIRRSDVRLKRGEHFDAELIGMNVYEDFIHRYVGVVEEVLTYPRTSSTRSEDRRRPISFPRWRISLSGRSTRTSARSMYT